MLKLKKKVTECARNIAWWQIFSLAMLNALDSVPSIKESWGWGLLKAYQEQFCKPQLKYDKMANNNYKELAL